MRLTLRTLLAYLDDTLDPAQAKLIGQKVAESTTAQELISRIKEVVRRRLATPPATGSGAKIDANQVAEYIDSVLSPEKLAEVEEICLESDIHLAEIVACHQILTVVLSEPALVPPTAKKRMYGLLTGRESIPSRKAEAGASRALPNAHLSERPDEEDEALLLGLPHLLRKGSWLRRAAPAVGIVILVVALAVAIWQALPHGRRSTPAHEDRLTRNEAAAPPRESVTDTKETSKAEEPLKTDPVKEPKPAPEEEPKPKPKEKPKEEPKAEPKTVPAGPSAVRREVGAYITPAKGVPSILLNRSKEHDVWRRVPPDGPVFTSEWLLGLPGFRDEIRLASGVQLSVWGNLPEGSRVFSLESLVMLHHDPEFDLDVTLSRGRIAIANRKEKGTARVRVRFDGETWDLTLLQPGTQVALELWGFYPPGTPFSKDVKGDGPLAGLGLFAMKGLANLKIRYDTHMLREPPGNNLFLWDNTGPAQREPRLLAADSLPGWARKTPPPLPKERKPMIAALEGLATRLNGKATLDVVLPELLKDADHFGRVLGVFCLGAVDDLPGLLDCLSHEKHREVRVAAIHALRHWIGLGTSNEAKLHAVLENKYRSGPAEIVMTLLLDYSEKDRTDPLTYETLIAYLKHEKLAIRELAYTNLLMLVPEGAKIAYDPAGGIDQRDRAYEDWKRLIPDSKLPQPPIVKPRPAKPN